MKKLGLLVAALLISSASDGQAAYRYGAGYRGWYGPGRYYGGPVGWGVYPRYYAGPRYYGYPGIYPGPYGYPGYFAYPYPSYYPYPIYAQAPTYYIQQPPPVVAAAPPPPAAPRPPAPKYQRFTLSAKELFAFDRSDLAPRQPKLDEIAAALTHNPQIRKITITGYTDRLGTDAYNMRLSQHRADAVKAYLVSKGVAANRLIAIGKGESDPVVHCSQTNQAALIACLEPNRRVEIEQFTFEVPPG